MNRWKALMPLAGTAALIALLAWRVSPTDVARAMGEVQWPGIVAATAALALVIFFWDGVCLRWLFRDRRRPLRYPEVLQARASAYLGTVLHFGLGQGLLAWQLARRQQKPVLAAMARCAAMAFVDLWVLLGLGLVGASLSQDPRTRGVDVFCLGALLLLAAVTLTVRFAPLPHRVAAFLQQSRWFTWWHATDLTWGTVALLYPLRLAYFIMGLAHASVILRLAGFQLDRSLVLSILPITAIVDALPLSVAGLGTREAMLLAFLQPDRPATLLACTLLWWTAMLLSRAAIGLVVLWWSGLDL